MKSIKTKKDIIIIITIIIIKTMQNVLCFFDNML